MKLDLLNNQWLDIVFEGRNKSYGAYDLRKSITNNTVKAFVIGTLLFAVLVSIPTILRMIPEAEEEITLDQKITAVKMPPKKEKPKENLPPPPPPPPKVDQVKFVKPVVAKAEDVVEEIAVVKDLKDKNIGKETVKGDPNADFVVDEPVGNGPADVIEEDNTIYNSAGISVSAEFPGGNDKFREFVLKSFQTPDEEVSGKVIITFVVEKDGTMSDIKVVRDVGYGTGKEAIRVVKSCKTRWAPGEQNGKPARMQYVLPITIQTAE